MRSTLLFLAFVLVPVFASAQGFIRYYPPSVATTSTGSSFFVSGISLGNTSASPYANLYGDAANTLALRNGGTAGVPVPQTFNVYNFCDGAACATGYQRASLGYASNAFVIQTLFAGTGTSTDINVLAYGTVVLQGNNSATYRVNLNSNGFYSATNEGLRLGYPGLNWVEAHVSRSIQGSKSKALADGIATAFVRVAVADDDYEGGCFTWTAYAEDTATDARQNRTGHTCFAINNNSGTEAAVFSTGDSAVQVTAGTLTCTFDGNSGAADTIDLRATCDTSLAATTTLTLEYRLDLPSTATITPQ